MLHNLVRSFSVKLCTSAVFDSKTRFHAVWKFPICVLLWDVCLCVI